MAIVCYLLLISSLHLLIATKFQAIYDMLLRSPNQRDALRQRWSEVDRADLQFVGTTACRMMCLALNQAALTEPSGFCMSDMQRLFRWSDDISWWGMRRSRTNTFSQLWVTDWSHWCCRRGHGLHEWGSPRYHHDARACGRVHPSPCLSHPA